MMVGIVNKTAAIETAGAGAAVTVWHADLLERDGGGAFAKGRAGWRNARATTADPGS